MGGATEEDEAMKWFLQRANGGDVLVLRASGSDGYNDYLYSDLGIAVNSVETIVFNDASASDEVYIQDKISKAEAIWFAGGDQWNYVSYWKGNEIATLINEGITTRNIVIGGTSAGMAIQGGYYFSAENGTVTSATALNNPYNASVTVDNEAFLTIPFLSDVVTDSHYDSPDRKGRHVTFLARVLTDSGVEIKGIACDEYTAVCVDENGVAKVYGQYPEYDDNAYFIQVNCALANRLPETCEMNTPLTWNLEGEALKVYAVKGTLTGENTFDLSDWETGSGGIWQNWHVANGALFEIPSTMIDCSTSSVSEHSTPLNLSVVPNPFQDKVTIELQGEMIEQVSVIDAQGKQIFIQKQLTTSTLEINTIDFIPGMYTLCIIGKDFSNQTKLVKM